MRHWQNDEMTEGEEDQGNGTNACAFCRADIKEIKLTSRELLRLVDQHMTELISTHRQFFDTLRERQDNPWRLMNRMLLIITAGMALFVLFVFAHVYGIEATSQLVGAVRGGK